jgi:uncharacterized protein (TIGR00269 family)
MDCDRCGEPAVMHAAYSGQHLCESHLLRSVEKRVRSRIREDGLVPHDATPAAPTTWVVGLSGGKDSVVLTTLLHEIFADDPRIELVALSIHEGVAGYRDESLAACRELAAELDIRHEEVAFAEEYDVEMDAVAAEDPLDMAPCAYCGVFRRDALARYAEQFDADLLMTGHNLDDEAQTALMNVLQGDVDQMARPSDASMGPIVENDGRRERRVQAAHIPRAKPLRDVPEREVALYAKLRELPMHHATCPHAEESFRAELQELLYTLEEKHPGTRHSIMAGYEEYAGLAAEYEETVEESTGECAECGGPTSREVCRKCDLLAELGAT